MESKANNIVTELQVIKKVIESYNAQGFQVFLGNPDCLLTRLSNNRRILNASAAISMSDIQVFRWIADISPWRRALVIGNSFGFSTFIIAALCPGCDVDVIDAETEGSDNRLGSELTRKIAQRDFPGVCLTIGFSPRDLPKACRFEDYDFILIDGSHSNQQLVADYKGISGLRADNSVVYCHDVGMAKMHEGWSRIKTEMLQKDDEAFDLHFTSFGSTMVVRGNLFLKESMRSCCQSLDQVYYYFGARHIGIRTALNMLLRTLIYSTRYGHYIRRLREKIED